MAVAKRVSSLLVTANLEGASRIYGGLGFQRVDTGHAGCVGYVAGQTGVILVDCEFARRCWGDVAARELAERLAPYVFLNEAEQGQIDAQLLCDIDAGFGAREHVLRTALGPIILATLVG